MSNYSPAITLDDALAALRQVRVSTHVERSAPVAPMLGYHTDVNRTGADPKRRRIDDLNKTTPCFGCGKVGHWYKDHRAYAQALLN